MKSIVLNPKFTITNRITACLTRIERARGFLEAATLSENWGWVMDGQNNSGIRIV